MTTTAAQRYKGVAYKVFRQMLYTAQRGRCPICGRQLPAKVGSGKITFDHVHPKSRIASHEAQIHEGNLLLAHKACNADKADRKPTGCELLMLFVANRKLCFAERHTEHWEKH